MRKLVPSRTWRFILGISVVLIGLGSLAFSQLADESPDESPPLPGETLPGESSVGLASGGSASDSINKLRDDLAVARRALAQAKQTKHESDRRAEAELVRIRKDLERSKEDLLLAQRVIAISNPDKTTELKRLQDQIDDGLAKLTVRQQTLAREQGVAIRKLESLESELQASEGILADSLASGVSPEEALPAVSLLQDNLKRTHDEIVSSLNDSSRREKDAVGAVKDFESIVGSARREVAKARELSRNTDGGKELEAAELRNNLQNAIESVSDMQNDLGGSPARLKSEIGELDLGASRDKDAGTPSQEMIRQLQNEVDASQGLQASLNEDAEKLRNELKRAFRQMLSMQMKLEESTKLVGDLERQRDSLMKSRNQGITGVEGMNRLVARLEQELASSKAELIQARDSLTAEKNNSAAIINSLTTDLDRTKNQLERLKSVANEEGRDAVSMLELEEELNRSKAKLLAFQRQDLEKGTGSEELKNELKKAFGEIMRLRAELSGKEDLERQLAHLEATLSDTGETSLTASSPEYVNELIRILNATKLALNQARQDQEKVRRSLSKEVADLEDTLQQSRDEIDLAQVDMARKELDFSDLVKSLESELSVTQRALRQAADAHHQGSDVIEIMDADLGVAQSRMQAISSEIEKERMEAARHIRDLQIELEASRRRQQAILNEVSEKDELISNKDDELERTLARASALQEQLKEVDSMSRTLDELNTVLRSTESVQNVNVDQANALTAQLRDELEQAKVEALLAKQSKEDVERRAGSRVDALEKQLKDTQNQLELTKGQFHEVTGEGAELIAELNTELNQAGAEITRLKQAGSGETIGTENLASQLQEALGTIQVLQYNLIESEKVNAEVDDLRLRLASALEAKISEAEREDAATDSMRKKLRTLELETEMAQQGLASDRVKVQNVFSQLKDELEASQTKIVALESRLAQTDVSNQQTIADLDEELARANAEKSEVERRLHQLLLGKTETVSALERQLVLTKTRLDELEQNEQATAPTQARIVELEQQIARTQAELDSINELQRADGFGRERADDLEKQLVDMQKRLNQLLLAAQRGSPGSTPSSGVVTVLGAQLEEARALAVKLQSALKARDKENAEIESQLEKALENMMDMQMAGDGGFLRSELDGLKRQLAVAQSKAMLASADPADVSALTVLQLEIKELKSQLDRVRQNQPLDKSVAFSLLQREVDQLKKDLEQASNDSRTGSGAGEIQLRNELESATEKILDLQTQLASSKEKLNDMSALSAAHVSGDDATVALLSKKLQEAADAILTLKQNMAKSAAAVSKGQEDAAVLDEELEKSFQAMQTLKDEKDKLSDENKILMERASGLEELNEKLAAVNRGARQSSEADERLKREREDFMRRNLLLQTNLDKYKIEVRRLQESLAAPRGSVGNAANMQAQITALESQLQIAQTSEASAQNDFDQLSAQLKDAMREVMVLETNLGQAEGRIKQLESTAPPSSFSIRPSSPSGISPESSATKALRDEVLRLRAELEGAEAISGSRSQAEDRLRDTSRKLLASQMEMERSQKKVAILENQANKVEERRRSDVEREKAANQMVILLNDKLKREEAKTLALQEGLRKAREVIASLRGEPGASPIDSVPRSRGPSMFEASPRVSRFTPRSSAVPSRTRVPAPDFSSRFPVVRPRPLPSRSSSSDDWRSRTRTTPSSTPEGYNFRSSTPAGRTVFRGNSKVDFEVKVQFLNNQTKPASNVEFFLTKGLGIEDVAARAGIGLPPNVASAAELWARSIHRGYSYPGVAAKIRDALSQASVGRFKTNSSGLARLENLPAGQYFVVGTAPMGAVGVVWSQSVEVTDGAKVSLDLRNTAFAK